MNLEPEIFRSELSGDEYHLYHHPSGLDVLIMQMPGFTTTEALFAAKYGSVNNCFRTLDTGDFIKVPDGIAHYLEHKLFEGEECGVFERFAATGASANAFTSFDITAYTFSASSDYEEPLSILLDFVQHPFITDENVEKERGIIAQEIKMSDDSPTRALFFELLQSVYHDNPVNIDIAGTVESIQDITASLLMKCHGTFYNLNNMVLSIAGNVDDETVLRICDEKLVPSENKHLELFTAEEPDTVVKSRSVISREIGVPMFSLGFKCPPLKGRELLKTSIAADLMLKVLFGNMSDWYRNAFEQGLINSTFSTEVFSSEQGYFLLILSGEAKDPDAIYNSICDKIRSLDCSNFDSELLRTLIKGGYGSEIMKYNIVSECAEAMCFYYTQGVSCFDNLKIMSELTPEEVFETTKLLDTDRSSFCVVRK
ncbi:Predicted Zn-dependent peptidase [Ruminococcaceae bacterium FB2012]|nr:Predicted Zn-dependent peptidase [Ruminococcaceae bacterium FB2012]